MSAPRNGPVTVLHLVDTLQLGGTEGQLAQQLRVLDRRRWRPLAASLHATGPLAALFEAMDVPHAPFPLHAGMLHPNTAFQVARLAAWCRREKVSILHAHDFYSDVVAAAAVRLARLPFPPDGERLALVTSRRDLAHWLTPLQVAALGWACRFADRVVVNARVLAEGAVSELGVARDRLALVPNGIDLERFDAEAALAPDPPLEGRLGTPLAPRGAVPTVAMVASMHLPDKGHSDLLEATARLVERGRRLRVLLVGDGRERPHLEHAARRLALDGVVYFLGRRSDVPRLLRRVDLACLPSWAEGFPNALMEAMAAALPVVATNVGGCPELVDDGRNGRLVRPRDPEALAAALDDLLADRAAARRMGERARATVARRYTLSSSAAALDALYRGLGRAELGAARLAVPA